MTEQYVNANNLRLAYEEFGQQDAPVILLIMGLGMQMISWPDDFCQALADSGFRVIRFDNRDVGLSEKLKDAAVPRIPILAVRARFGLRLKVPYELHDMADDAIGLLDALDIDSAHIVGASMGGMIAQILAAHFPYRVRSLTSIMSTSGDRSLPGPSRKITLQMIKRPASTSEQDMLTHAMETWRLIGSPAYQPDDETLRERVRRSHLRSHYPPGRVRHMAAILAGGDRVSALAKVIAPTLVIHGKQDPLVPVEGGIDTAQRIQGAKLELIDGMGHDMPEALLEQFARLISAHAAASPL